MRVIIHKKLGVLLGLSIGLLSGGASSDDLISVYQLALENDKELSAARNENEAAQQAGRQRTGLYYPSMDLGYDHFETNQVINQSENDVFGSGESDFPTDVLSLSLNQPIFRWDYFSQRKVAKAEISQADYLLAAAEQGLMLRTAESYLLTLAAWDNEFVTKNERDAVAEQLRLAEKRLEVGLAHPTEVHESLARLEFTNSEVIVTENAVVDREEGLRVITGVRIDTLQPLHDAFDMVAPDPADESSWIAKALESNLTVKAREAAAAVELAKHEVRKADRYPTLDFEARFNNRDSGGSLFGGGSDVDTTDLILRANWKVFQGGILRARVKEAQYNKQRAEDDLALEKANVRRDTRNAYRSVVSAIAKSKALKVSMEAQEQAVKSKNKGFETGANSNIDVLDAKRDFFFVQRDYLKSRYEYLLSLLHLKRQVGSLSPADLQMVNGMLDTASTSVERGEKVRQMAQSTFLVPKQEVQEAVPFAVENTSMPNPDQRALEDNRWLFEQPESSYSLQVGSVRASIDAQKLIQKFPDAHYFYSGETDSAWYFVLSGSYPDIQTAQEAADELGVSNAVVRKITGVQKKRCRGEYFLSETVTDSIQQLCANAGLSGQHQPSRLQDTKNVAMNAR